MVDARESGAGSRVAEGEATWRQRHGAGRLGAIPPGEKEKRWCAENEASTVHATGLASSTSGGKPLSRDRVPGAASAIR
jgi:hypothetical protein